MIDFYASLSHYADHLRPIAEILSNRGKLWGPDDIVPDDGVPTVIAGQADLASIPASRPVCLVSHGVDQNYIDVDHGSYCGGRNRERVELFLCPNQRSVDANMARYPQARAVAVGSPRVELLRSLVGAGAPVPSGVKLAREHGLHSASVPTVALCWHWDLPLAPETRSAWSYYRPVIERLRDEFRFVGHGHPRHEHLAREYAEIGVEWVPDQAEAFALADVVCFDNTSAGYEAAACGIPVLALDAPWYRDRPRHGLRFYDQVPGLRLRAYRDQAADCLPIHPQWGRDRLGDALREALEDRPELVGHRGAVVGQVYAQIEGSAEAAAGAILDWLDL